MKLDLQTPFEVFHGYKPKINHLRVYLVVRLLHIFQKMREENLMQNQLNAYLLATALIKKQTNCFILVHINCL